MTDILSKENDVAVYFGVDCDDPDARLVWLIQGYVESAVRKFVRHGVSQQTYTEFQRKTDIGSSDVGYSRDYELIGDSVYTASRFQHHGQYLQLDNGYVRSVASVYEDYSATFGSSGDFAASTEITEGTDFYLELDEAGMSKSGRLIRENRGWSTRPGTIKITYTAGFAPSELSDEYAFVKHAILREMSEKLDMARVQQNGGAGRLKKETIFGDIQREYAVDTKTQTRNQLSFSTMSELRPIQTMRL